MTATEQLGLLENCTGFDDDPSGPWGLVRGGLVRNLRPSPPRFSDARAAETQTILEYSRDGEHWSTLRVFNHELKTGDVSAIRAELAAPLTLPPAPEGAVLIVRARCVGGNQVELKRVGPDYQYAAPFLFPGRIHDFSAFAADGTHLGTFTTGYELSGWRKFVGGSSPGPAANTLLTVRELASDGSPVQRREWERVTRGETVLTFERS